MTLVNIGNVYSQLVDAHVIDKLGRLAYVDKDSSPLEDH